MRDAGATGGSTIAARASIPSAIEDQTFAAEAAATAAAIVVAVVVVFVGGVGIASSAAAAAGLAPYLPCHLRFSFFFFSAQS